MYKSDFEEDLHKKLKGFEYEDFNVPYSIHANYTPDFTHSDADFAIESKGFFRQGDQRKYRAISVELPLVFILYHPNRKVRKGAKMTMAQWCEKYMHGWVSREDVLNSKRPLTLKSFKKLIKYGNSKR